MDNGCQELGEKKEGKLWLKVKTRNKETKNNQENKQTKNILYFLEKKV